MPLPWRKSRVSRISRMVVDLQPPNRENSLVVETGFPTSLVDLFVKNRDRLKKPSMKKKKKNKLRKQKKQEEEEEEEEEEFNFDGEEELVISDPIPLSSSRDLEFLSASVCVGDKFQEPDNLERKRNFDACNCELMVSGDQNQNQSSNFDFDRVVVVDENLNLNLEKGKLVVVMKIVLKIFVLVVLALSTKKLVVGLTMSALVLIFIEYVVKRLFFLSKPYFDFRGVLQSLLKIEKSFVGNSGKNLAFVKKEEEIDTIDNDVSLGSRDLVEVCEFKSGKEEIEVVESNVNVVAWVDENRRVEMVLDRVGSYKESGYLDDEMKFSPVDLDGDKSVVLICQKDKIRGDKIKTKFVDRLLPKKLRGKKGKKSKEIETDSNPNKCRVRRREDNKKGDLDKGKLLLSQLLEEKDEEVEEDHAIFGHGTGISRSISGLPSRKICKTRREIHRSKSEGSLAMKEVSLTKEVVMRNVEFERKGITSCLFLITVALFGLVGGSRILALLLTVSVCWILILVRRGHEVSADKCKTAPLPSRPR